MTPFDGGRDAENLDAFAGQLFFGTFFHTGHSQKVCSQCVFSCELSDCCSARMTCCIPRIYAASRLKIFNITNGNLINVLIALPV